MLYNGFYNLKNKAFLLSEEVDDVPLKYVTENVTYKEKPKEGATQPEKSTVITKFPKFEEETAFAVKVAPSRQSEYL